MGRMSERALRDYAYRVLKYEVGEHIEDGIVIPAKYTDEQISMMVNEMPDWQLDEMYNMIYGSEMVE